MAPGECPHWASVGRSANFAQRLSQYKRDVGTLPDSAARDRRKATLPRRDGARRRSSGIIVGNISLLQLVGNATELNKKLATTFIVEVTEVDSN